MKTMLVQEYLEKQCGFTPVMEAGDETILREGTVDFYTLSYYMSSCAGADSSSAKTDGNITGGLKNPYLTASEWGWQIDPDGLHYTLNEIYDRYQIPIMVVENGLGAKDEIQPDGSVQDEYRIDYLRRHIDAMAAAVEDGTDLINRAEIIFHINRQHIGHGLTLILDLCQCVVRTDLFSETKGTFHKFCFTVGF